MQGLVKKLEPRRITILAARKPESMKQRSLILFSIILLFACSQTEQKSENAEQSEQQTSQVATTLPTLPDSLLQLLRTRVTNIEVTFYNEPFTMSHTDPKAIAYVVGHIAPQPVQIGPSCQPGGHMIYVSGGDILLEADFYYANGCALFLFTDRQKNRYANAMTQEGLNYIFQNIEQAAKMRQQMQQGNPAGH